MKNLQFSLLLPVLAAAAPCAHGGESPVPAAAAPAPLDVGVGDPRRKAVLDALRAPIEKELGQRVQFLVARLRETGGWAFATVIPQQPDGKAIDFATTRYREAIDEGVFDGPTTYALLRRVDGAWKVLAFAIGPTDVAWAGWSGEFGAPAALFP